MKTSTPRAERPLLVVGSGRSGTTVLYEILAGHPDLGWISNVADRRPEFPTTSLLTRLHPWTVGKRLPFGRLIPSEAYGLWNFCRPVDPQHDHPLTEQDASESEVSRTRRLVDQHMRFHGRGRFLNKNTRNTRRLRYLNRIFPDALFVHVLRDPRAVVSSMSRVAFWRQMPVWCRDGATPARVTAEGGDHVALAAELWKAEVACALDHSGVIPGNRYLELRYEDFMADPVTVLQALCRFAGLPWCRPFEAHVRTFELRSQNFKFSSDFSTPQLQTINEITGALACQLGYDGTEPVVAVH
jgi:hypothetical protein